MSAPPPCDCTEKDRTVAGIVQLHPAVDDLPPDGPAQVGLFS